MHTDQHTSPFKSLLGISAVALLLIVILYSLGFIGGEAKIVPGLTPITPTNVPANAELIKVGKQTVDAKQSWPGTVQSRTLTRIAPKLPGRILSIKVNSGDKVTKGALIAQLDPREIDASVNEANSALNAARAVAAQAQADAQRSQELFTKEATTKASHDAVVARAKTTQAEVARAANHIEQIRVSLGENTLYAPFDGIVAERLMEPGDMAMPGKPIITLLKPDDLRVEANLPSACMRGIQSGMTVKVRIDALNQTLSAKVDEISPEVNPQTGLQLVKAALPPTANLRSGQFAWLEQNCVEQQTELMIPVEAVLHFGQLEAVKVVDNKIVYTRHIRTGKPQGNQISVVSGLREGETIIRNSEILQGAQ